MRQRESRRNNLVCPGGIIAGKVGASMAEKKTYYYALFPSPFCDIFVAGNGTAVQMLHLDTGEGKRRFAVDEEWVRADTVFEQVGRQLKEYFSLKRQIFTVPVEPIGTAYQQQVWRALQSIPYGEVRTYKEIATLVGNKNGSRAVGSANSRNPIPLLIPCHRVIGTGGSLVGFAHGTTIKRQLLELEKAGVSGLARKGIHPPLFR